MQTSPIEAERPLEPHQVIADAFAPVSRELDVDLKVTGRLPDGLDGVLFRNGPGALEMGADRYMHPFDGDGMIVRFDLSARGVRYQNRFVATRERTAELRAGKMLHRAFGTNLPGGSWKNLLRLRFKNAANTNVIWHGGRLLALWEGGVPHRLEPDNLATRSRLGSSSTSRRARSRRSRSGLTPSSSRPSTAAGLAASTTASSQSHGRWGAARPSTSASRAPAPTAARRCSAPSRRTYPESQCSSREPPTPRRATAGSCR